MRSRDMDRSKSSERNGIQLYRGRCASGRGDRREFGDNGARCGKQSEIQAAYRVYMKWGEYLVPLWVQNGSDRVLVKGASNQHAMFLYVKGEITNTDSATPKPCVVVWKPPRRANTNC